MTAQPTAPISSPYDPQDPTEMPAWGATPEPFPHFSGGGYPAPFGPPPAAPRRRTARIIGLVASVLVVLADLGTAALFLFGPRVVEPQSVQDEIVRITRTAVGATPTDLHCPAKIKAQTGGTFTCTGVVDQQPVTYDVRQDDDKGHLTITYDRLIKMTDIESALAAQVGKDVEVAVTISCEPAGRTVVVNKPGAPISCTATNTTNSTDNAKINVTVAADGTPSYTWA